MRITLSLLMMASMMPAPAIAAGDSVARLSRDEQAVPGSETFLDAHPDLKYQQLGWEAYQEGHFEKAIGHFKQAALYADSSRRR